MYILRHENNGKRLCKDGSFRDFACFGSFPECVKVYRSFGWAEKKQLEFFNKDVPVEILSMKNKTMNAMGRIFDYRK